MITNTSTIFRDSFCLFPSSYISQGYVLGHLSKTRRQLWCDLPSLDRQLLLVNKNKRSVKVVLTVSKQCSSITLSRIINLLFSQQGPYVQIIFTTIIITTVSILSTFELIKSHCSFILSWIQLDKSCLSIERGKQSYSRKIYYRIRYSFQKQIAWFIRY